MYCFTIDVITHVVLYNSLLMHIILSQRSEVKGENPIKFCIYMPLRNVFDEKWLRQQLLPVQVNTINY